MEVGTEISQKIRSAIKAKLMELGSYVDDELPDYIMVMVANKKNREQMAGDLGLFLGTNTDAFTEWLHELLTKLQKINETTKAKDGKSKEKKKDKSKKKDKKKDGKSKSKKIESVSVNSAAKENQKKQSEVENASNPSINADLNKDDRSRNSQIDSDRIQKDGEALSGSASVPTVVSKTVEETDEVEDVRQLLVTEEPSDELAQELQTETVEESVELVRKTVSVRVNSPPRRTQTVRKLSRSKSMSPERTVVQAKKRKIPTSVVSSVNKVAAEEDEEYDPYNPAVGSVASVVKVTKRKSSIPPALQANRSLLVKAMSEAERSIAVKRKVGVTRPMSRDESPGETYSPKRRRSNDARHEDTPPPYIPSKKETSASQLSKAESQREKTQGSKLSQHDARHLLNKDECRELISRSRRRELLRAIGIDRDEEKPVKEKKFEHSREVKDEATSSEVRNFTITARVVPSKSHESLELEEKSRKPRSISPQEHRQSSPGPRKKGPISSRLGKVVLERSPSPVEERKPCIKTADVRPRPKESVDRMALSKLGKDLVNKQCQAAVLSVKAARIPRGRASDSRVVQCDKDEDRRSRSASLERAPEKLVKKEGKASPHSLEEEDLADMLKDSPVEDEFTLDLEEEDLSQVLEREANEARSQALEAYEKKKGTRFIVTLDGVDERRFEEEVKSSYSQVIPGCSNVLSALAAQTKPVPHSVLKPFIPTASIPAKMAPPKIQPFNICLKDSDDEHDGKVEPVVLISNTSYQEETKVLESETSSPALTALQKAKQNERCKFWPACMAGAQCEYHHPTVHCKTFPNCIYGDKCLFIHPNCRFDSKCMRPDCPFTHTSRRSTSAVIAIPQPQILAITPKPYPGGLRASMGPSQSTVCRFYPNCLNVNCGFLHPKPCRFGGACAAPGCPFYHPPMPCKDKLKWQAPQAAGSQNLSPPMAQLSSKPVV